ncbi:MAG: hypothetical protein K8T20_01140 [Planctomycetes bacterium]|nr:hypothetical protein [Planctomycetota bacterium]
MRTAVRLLLLVGIAGCVSSRQEHLSSNRYPPKPENFPIQFFDTEADVKRPFEKIARIYINGTEDASWQAMSERIKEDARKLGADAVILGREDETSRGFWTEGSKRKEAVAIKFNDEK